MVKNSLPGQSSLSEVVGVLKALADPNRLYIFELLMAGEACNCELNEQLGLPPNLLSHHLRVLRQAGLIQTRRDLIDSRWIYYSINKEALNRWHTWLGEFFDPVHLQMRPALCGPEGQQASPAGEENKTKRCVLFLCTGNSCRSQMAEAIVNTRLREEWQAVSAGTQPAGAVHPKAIAILAEIGIDWQGHASKPVDEFRSDSFDLVVTLCDNARQNCPDWLDQSVHLGFPDPAKATGSEEEVLATFRTVCDAIAEQVPAFLRRQAAAEHLN